jgi:hypothetical protein
MRSQQILLSHASILALLAVANAAAGDIALASDFGPTEHQATLPAVSGLNAKIGGFGAALSGDAAGGVFLGLAFPLGHGYGAQIDGLVGTAEGGDAFHGLGGHLFWRDPSRALVGIYASHVQWETDSAGSGSGRSDLGKVGFEGQLYLGRLSLEGLAAYQFGSDDGFAGKGAVAYYPRDDLRLHVAVTHYAGPGFAASTGFEWAPHSGSGMSLFADVGVNESHDVRALVGLKLYASRNGKSLIRRHREDDPDVDLPSDLFHTSQTNQPGQSPPGQSPSSESSPCPPGQVLIDGFCDGNT